MIKYKIGNKEYEASHRIDTTVFLDRCRILHFAADMIVAYREDEKFRSQVDAIVRMGASFEVKSMLLGGSLQNILDQWLENGWYEPQELGEEEIADENGLKKC